MATEQSGGHPEENLPKNFTPRAQKVLALAREEAERLRHRFVGTEHLLLGLIKLPQGVSVTVLQKLGLNLESIRAEVEKHAPADHGPKIVGKISYAPGAKEALALAARGAAALNHAYVGTEHILIGLLTEGEGVSARVFAHFNVDMAQTRLEILKELAPRGRANPDARRNNFSPHAQQVLALARNEADRLHHNFAGTEHLLLAMIRLGQGTAVAVLRKRDVNLESLALEIEKQIGVGPDPKMIGNIPYTPRVKRVLELAAKEAQAMNQTYVGTQHILLGLLRDGDGVAARLLKQFGLEIEQTRKDILRESDPGKNPQ